ncbi:MAG: GlsB/YeaQ/YmgE family stress response membrane protein [Methylotenera sp.]|nr:GlsB/YeaQ/YmgE family stress response membrane protein [Oligoflexia bacterium]
MFHLIGFIVFGFIVGLIARAIMPGRDNMSIPMTCLLGVVGSVAAGWLGRAFNWYGPEDGAGFIMSTIGAVILLVIYSRVVSKRGVLARSTDKNYPRRVA